MADSDVRVIDPSLFTKLMRLPDATRGDLLEFLGATPVADVHLAEMIEKLTSRRPETERRAAPSGAN